MPGIELFRKTRLQSENHHVPVLTFELELIKVPRRQVGLFSKQLGLLLNSGIGLIEALEILSAQEEYPRFGEIVEVLAQKLLQGYSLSHGMTFFPLAFPPTLRALVRIGEQTGGLPHTLSSASQWLERDTDLYRKLRSTLTYPLFVIGFATFLTFILFTTVVPQFMAFLSSSRIEPPLPTMMVLLLTKLMLNPGTYIVVAGLVGFLWLFWSHEKDTPERAALWTGRLYQIPILGHLFQVAALARFAFSSATLLNRGTPLDRAIGLAANASNSPVLVEDSRRLISEIEQGEGLAGAMRPRKELYGNRLIHFVAAGEESAKLPHMLSKSGALFQMELDLALERIPVLVEPLILSFLGGMVALVLLSLFLPLYSVIGGLS